MKNLISLLTCLFIVSLLTAQPYSKPKAKVMILGMYHMANPNADMANIKADDVKSPKRQQDLEALTEMLRKFKPTKIALESPFGSNYHPKRYAQFLEHKSFDSLNRSESQQIGYRLAAKLGHETVYPIDFRMNISPPSMEDYFKKHPKKQQEFGLKMKAIQDSLHHWSEKHLYNNSIAHFLHFMNREEMIQMNYALYIELMKDLMDDELAPGAEMLAKWHERNLMIFQNLIRITDFNAEEERILVIFGQGHSKILIDLVQDAYFYEQVDVNDFLISDGGN